MVPIWRFFCDFFASCISASRVQHISDLHSKFALRPYFHVWKYGRHPICAASEIRRGKNKIYRKKVQDANIIVCPIPYGDHRNRQNRPSGHHRTTLSGHIFATKARIDNRKKLVKQQYLLQMSPQYAELRPLAAEIGPVVWGTPANFNGFRV